MNRLELLRVFCVAAEADNFKAAATRLSVSPQVVTRAIQALEEAQSELLFHRNTRGVRLTDFGAAFASRARALLNGCDALFPDQRRARDAEAMGLVRITAPASLGRSRLMPIVAGLLKKHPDLRIDLRLSDARADVVDEKIDIGVRAGFVRDNRFVARKLAKLSFHVVGTPTLVAKQGVPKRIEDLANLRLTALLDVNTGRPWPWLFAGGRQFVPDAPILLSDDVDAEYAAVLAGTAFGQIPSYLAAAAIQRRKLVAVLKDQAPEPWDLYIYRPQRRPVPQRVSLVFEALMEMTKTA
jgi:DNA-binding transcriptional LysR family regulator